MKRNVKYISSSTFDPDKLGNRLTRKSAQPTFCPGGGFTSTTIEAFMSGTAQMPGMLSPRSALDIPSDLDNPVNDRNPFVLNQDQDLPPSVNELPIPSIGDEDVENS